MQDNTRHPMPSLAESLESRLLLAGEPWGAFPKMIQQDLAITHYPTLTGAGQAVAVIDTGVDYRHPALGGGLGPGFKVVAGYDFVDNDPDPMDPDSHGTGVAGVIAAADYVYRGERYRGLAPAAKIIALRADDGSSQDQAANDARVEQALQWVLRNRTQYNIVAVNLSIGSGLYANSTTEGPYSDELAALADAGVFIAAASGNGGATSPPGIEYPAAHPDVYAIGSVNARDIISRFTERSKDLDLLAPGEKVPVPYYDSRKRRAMAILADGTSFAAPHAVAAAVLLKQADPALTPEQIIRILRDSGSANYDGDGEAGPTTGLTFKRLRLDAALAMLFRGRTGDQLPAISPNAISAAYDSRGNLHVAYQDAISRTLRYTSRNPAGQWSAVQVVDSSPDVAGSLSLAIDKKNRPVIAYYDAPNTRLKIAWSNGHQFKSATLDDAGDTGEFPSLLYTPKGVPWITYYRRSSGDLYYATLRKRRWEIGPLDTAGDTGLYSSIAINPRTNRVAVAYADASQNTLRYREHTKRRWVDATLDTLAGGARHISLAFNAAGQVAISYQDYAGDSLKLARRDAAGKWSTQTIIAPGSQGAYSNVVFASGSAHPEVFHHNQTEEAVYRATFDGSQWHLARQGQGGYFLNVAANRGGEKTLLWRNAATGRMEAKVLS